MIVTKNWLQEWIDISDLTTETVCETLNAIGLEVDSVEELHVPDGVVVGKVLECQKHPDADKLNLCQVDIGSEVTQIVCGAKNVAAGQMVPVATLGADLGNGFVIKKAKLRGVESNGMICGASEIGLPEMNDGILVLDESLGELVLGTPLNSFALLQDTIIEIELTANRGDCLSVRGVARDLSAALKRELKPFSTPSLPTEAPIDEMAALEEEEGMHALVRLGAFDLKAPRLSFAKAFLLACVQKYTQDPLLGALAYATHSTGVILHLLDKEACQEEKVVLSFSKDSLGIESLLHDKTLLYHIGIKQYDTCRPKTPTKEGRYMVCASYIDPELVSSVKMEKKVASDDTFYHASRGSESDLALGTDYFFTLLLEEMEVALCKGVLVSKEEPCLRKIEVSKAFIESFIGQAFEVEEIVALLERLEMGVVYEDGIFTITIAPHRADISHSQDIIEEIVRLVGIDNIVAKPLEIVEKRRIDESYSRHKQRSFFRHKAAGAGFFESVHYFFDNKKLMQKYGISTLDESLDITNPISEELNTLRTTLVLHLIESAGKNSKNGKKSILLFELGRVVNTQREESEKIAFLHSGLKEEASLLNSGKPQKIDFFTFCDEVSSVVGALRLQKPEKEQIGALFSPYEYALVMIDGKEAGFIGRLHVNVEKEFGLESTYVCEIDFDALLKERVVAKAYSKFPALTRDLSLMVPTDLPFAKIQERLASLPDEVVHFYPIDLYKSEALGDKESVTVRFEIQSQEKTLTEEEINAIMEQILAVLEEEGIALR